MVHLDPQAVHILTESLRLLGYTGDHEHLQCLLVRGERDTADRELLSVWGMPGNRRYRMVGRILAHARKHDLWRHPGQRHVSHLTFWSLYGGTAVRMGSVEFSANEIRLVFFRNSECLGYVRLDWDGRLVERMNSSRRLREERRAGGDVRSIQGG